MVVEVVAGPVDVEGPFAALNSIMAEFAVRRAGQDDARIRTVLNCIVGDLSLLSRVPIDAIGKARDVEPGADASKSSPKNCMYSVNTLRTGDGMLEHRNVAKTKLVSLLTILGEVPDPRVARSREHDLVELLVIALCTLLCRGESFYDMEGFARVRLKWLRTFLTLRGGVPSHDAFNRVSQALDPKKFADCLARWTQSVRKVKGQQSVEQRYYLSSLPVAWRK